MIVQERYDPPKVTSHTMSDGQVIQIAWTHSLTIYASAGLYDDDRTPDHTADVEEAS